jgi:uncharacterized protein YndB with AHSA1/START domain
MAQNIATSIRPGSAAVPAIKTIFTAEPRRQEIVITCTFEAPPELVFKTYTDPELIPQWWGPRTSTTAVDRMELRPGGLWRFVQRDAGGGDFAFHGVYHEVTPPGRLVYTFEFEGMPGHAMLEAVTFEEHDGGTRLTDRIVYQSVEDRDGMLAAGMETGSSESIDRLAELLAKVRSLAA